jgi:putative flippase GtrA
MLPERRIELRRLTVFVVVGTVNNAIFFALYAAMVEWLDWDYQVSLVADYAIAIVVGYLLHRVSTFADRKDLRQAFRKYTITLIGAFLLNWLALAWIVERDLLSVLPAQAVAVTLATLVSYVVQKRWVFRSHAVAQAGTENKATA